MLIAPIATHPLNMRTWPARAIAAIDDQANANDPKCARMRPKSDLLALYSVHAPQRGRTPPAESSGADMAAS